MSTCYLLKMATYNPFVLNSCDKKMMRRQLGIIREPEMCQGYPIDGVTELVAKQKRAKKFTNVLKRSAWDSPSNHWTYFVVCCVRQRPGNCNVPESQRRRSGVSCYTSFLFSGRWHSAIIISDFFFFCNLFKQKWYDVNLAGPRH